jgi:hypothetical protein
MLNSFVFNKFNINSPSAREHLSTVSTDLHNPFELKYSDNYTVRIPNIKFLYHPVLVCYSSANHHSTESSMVPKLSGFLDLNYGFSGNLV